MNCKHTGAAYASLKQLTLVALVAMASVGTVLAHHSGAMFDRTKPVELKGVVAEWRWVNPHVFLKLEVKDQSGKQVVWTIEGREVRYYVEQGLTRLTFKPGDAVTVTIAPLRDGDAGGQIMGAVLADGTHWGQVKGAN